MKTLFAAVAVAALFASPAFAGPADYSSYDPTYANTSDPNSAPLMHDPAPRTFTRDAAALANTADPNSAPLLTNPPVSYRGFANDAAATADTSDPDSVHVFRTR